MPDASARISVALTAQVRDDGAFPSITTYPASFERYLVNGTNGQTVSKVYAAAGTVGDSPVTLPVSATLTTVKVWYVENLAPATGTAGGSITVANAPVSSVVPRGQIVLATNDATGWPATSVTLTAAAGTPYKVIALGN